MSHLAVSPTAIPSLTPDIQITNHGSLLLAYVDAYEKDRLNQGELTEAVARRFGVSERQARTHRRQFRNIIHREVANGNGPLRHLYQLLSRS